MGLFSGPEEGGDSLAGMSCLTIARRILDVHSWLIRATSEGVGTGTTFRFTLPDVPE
jgi:signal transduction histidine kinase